MFRKILSVTEFIRIPVTAFGARAEFKFIFFFPLFFFVFIIPDLHSKENGFIIVIIYTFCHFMEEI